MKKRGTDTALFRRLWDEVWAETIEWLTAECFDTVL